MAALGEKDLTLTIYGLDVQGAEVDALVFAEKLKKVVSALKRLDAFYNVKGLHRFMINDLVFSSASVSLRETQIKAKKIRRSPAKRFAEIGSIASIGSQIEIENAADEYALKAYQSLSEGSGKTFSYGVVECPDVATVRVDRLLGKRVRDIIEHASAVASAAPQRYFRGTAIETYDGVVKAVDLRGLFPEARLILSAGSKEISCVVAAKDIGILREALDNRALVTGVAHHGGRSMLPERIDVSSIRLITTSGNVIELRGALKNLDSDEIREFR